MLDEPFANIDPTTQFRLKSILKDLNKNKGVTTLISSHDLNHITDVCDRILLMEKGKIIKDIATNSGTLSELEAYFGVGMMWGGKKKNSNYIANRKIGILNLYCLWLIKAINDSTYKYIFGEQSH